MRTTVTTLVIVAAGALGSVAFARQNAGRAPETVKEVMTSMTIPASDAIFDAASEPPTRPVGWAAAGKAAATLAESGRLLMTDALARDKAAWMDMAAALVKEAEATVKAVDGKDRDALEVVGDRIYATCATCHGRYMAAN